MFLLYTIYKKLFQGIKDLSVGIVKVTKATYQEKIFAIHLTKNECISD